MTVSSHLHLAWNASPDERERDEAPGAGTWAATVIAVEGGTVALDRNGGRAEASVALSCLVMPEPGDRVLVGRADGADWVLAVLRREGQGAVRLSSERDIAIVSTNGSVAVAAAQSVSLDAGERARVSTGALELHAVTARLVLDEVLHVGRVITAHVGKLRSIGELVETFAEHVLTRARRSSRFIEEADNLRSGEIDHRAEGTMQLQAKTAFITAETVVRVDADQIHMG